MVMQPHHSPPPPAPQRHSFLLINRKSLLFGSHEILRQVPPLEETRFRTSGLLPCPAVLSRRRQELRGSGPRRGCCLSVWIRAGHESPSSFRQIMNHIKTSQSHGEQCLRRWSLASLCNMGFSPLLPLLLHLLPAPPSSRPPLRVSLPSTPLFIEPLASHFFHFLFHDPNILPSPLHTLLWLRNAIQPQKRTQKMPLAALREDGRPRRRITST